MNTAQAQQFAALQKATASHNGDARGANQARSHEAKGTARTHERYCQGKGELRIAHGKIGEETRRRENLNAERRRLGQAAEADRRAIVGITSELNGIEVRAAVSVCRAFVRPRC